MKKRKFAFTLAEVLITLGIIGVVAAMTIPTLISNFQKRAWETILKEDYALVSEGLLRLMADDQVKYFDPIELSASDFRKNELDLTPIDILALEDFVIFKEEVDC